jgi:ribonuclease HI
VLNLCTVDIALVNDSEKVRDILADGVLKGQRKKRWKGREKRRKIMQKRKNDGR